MPMPSEADTSRAGKEQLHRIIDRIPENLLPVAEKVLEAFHFENDLRYLYYELPFEQRHRWGGDVTEFVEGVRAARIATYAGHGYQASVIQAMYREFELYWYESDQVFPEWHVRLQRRLVDASWDRVAELESGVA